ncbi:MAG: hypothetical protein IPG09_10015 [Ignavibacteria bacterium]|nr:hypothetical protein [Ignavibacteria bacterium]
MKTKFSKFLFLLWLFNLSNAYSQYDYIENLKKNSLKIQSAKIKSCNEKLENNKGLRYYREYDTQERIVYLNNWYNGQLQFERKYFYDEKGNLIKMDNDKDKPYNIYSAYYEYDERGLLIGEIRQSKHNKDRPPLTFKFIYDENLNLTQEIFEQGNSDFYTYENNRNQRKLDLMSLNHTKFY